MTTLRLATSATTTDLLVLGLVRGADGPSVAVGPGITDAQATAVTAAARSVGATGKVDEVLRLPGEPYDLPALMLAGLGDEAGADAPAALHRAAGAALRTAAATDVTVALPTGDDPDRVAAVAQGALIGAYRIVGRPAADPPVAAPEQVTLLVGA
ncbi:MAG: hypothetical protein MUF35_07065, partial [Candidatus Nanopelagicales bacterium]|nr:hypothetical protein [Candidatus Nanopelagicales bacterium]